MQYILDHTIYLLPWDMQGLCVLVMMMTLLFTMGTVGIALYDYIQYRLDYDT